MNVRIQEISGAAVLVWCSEEHKNSFLGAHCQILSWWDGQPCTEIGEVFHGFFAGSTLTLDLVKMAQMAFFLADILMKKCQTCRLMVLKYQTLFCCSSVCWKCFFFFSGKELPCGFERKIPVVICSYFILARRFKNQASFRSRRLGSRNDGLSWWDRYCPICMRTGENVEVLKTRVWILKPIQCLFGGRELNAAAACCLLVSIQQ